MHAGHHNRLRTRTAAVVSLLLAGWGLGACQDQVEFTRRPNAEVYTEKIKLEAAPIFISAQVNMAPLNADLEEVVPERVAKISRWIKKAACVEKNGRKRCASARVRGEVHRLKPPRLAPTPDGFNLEFPVAYDFDVKGGGVASKVKTEVSGEVLVKVPYTVAIDQAWQADVAFDNEIETDGSPEIAILEGSLNLADLVLRNYRRKLRKLTSKIEAELQPSGAAKDMARAWRELHKPIELSKAPAAWLQAKPQYLEFAGFKMADDGATARVAIFSELSIHEGERPEPAIAQKMPEPKTPSKLASSSSTPGETQLLMPLTVPFEELDDKVKSAAENAPKVSSKRGEENLTFTVKGAKLIPANGRLGIAAKIDAVSDGSWGERSGTLYLFATPSIDTKTGMLQVTRVEFTSPTPSPTLHHQGRFLLPEKPFADAFRRIVKLDLRDRFEKARNRANQLFDARVGDGQRLNGRFDRYEVHSVEVGKAGLKVNLLLKGDISIRPTSDKLAAGVAAGQAATAQ